MQHSVIMSGIGGQGIVVGTKLMGITATAVGRYCLHFAAYGGEMRGTKCECTLTIGTEPVTSPAEVSTCSAAIIMHPENYAHLAPKIVPGGLGFINSSIVHLDPEQLRKDVEWLFVPCTDIGKEIGHLMVATMVAISAFSEETGLVPPGAIKDALPEVIPPYRHKMLEMDAQGIDVGADYIARGKAQRIPSSVPYIFAKARV